MVFLGVQHQQLEMTYTQVFVQYLLFSGFYNWECVQNNSLRLTIFIVKRISLQTVVFSFNTYN